MADTEVAPPNSKPFGEGVGPKKYGIKTDPFEEKIEQINKQIMEDDDYKEVEELEEKLQSYKAKFLEFEPDKETGLIDLFGLKRMMEKLGQAKTHIELKKMIAEIDKSNLGKICYQDFVVMMVGPKTSVLKLILLFEEKAKGQEKKTGVAPKRDISSLP